MSSADDAREYLRLIRSTPSSLRGPHRLYDKPVNLSRVRALAQGVSASVERTGDRHYRAPSAWHAAAWLRDQAALAGQVASVDGGSGMRLAYDPRYGAPLFRGQRSAGYRLTASMFREARVAADTVLALELFIDAMSDLMNYDENRVNGRFVHMTAAQHYGGKDEPHGGLPTPLLDFTADPTVAVAFACEKAPPETHEQVVVYFMPLGDLAALGGRILLPPPWLKRLWSQRGMFLDCSLLPEQHDLRDFCIEIRFPPDPAFTVEASESNPEGLSPPGGWIVNAIGWAKATVRSADGIRPTDSLGAMLASNCGEPPFRWYALFPDAIQEHLRQAMDLCDWVALKVVNQQSGYDLGALDMMLKDNLPLFRSWRVAARFLEREFGGTRRSNDPRLEWAAAIRACVDQAAARGAIAE